LHDHPELVEQRLQPGHPSAPSLTRAPRWSGLMATWARRSRSNIRRCTCSVAARGRTSCRLLLPAPASPRTQAVRSSISPRIRPAPSPRSRSSKDGGQATYRGLLKVAMGAVHTKSFVRCDALLLDEQSRSDTYPSIEIDEEQADIGHQAT